MSNFKCRLQNVAQAGRLSDFHFQCEEELNAKLFIKLQQWIMYGKLHRF